LDFAYLNRFRVSDFILLVHPVFPDFLLIQNGAVSGTVGKFDEAVFQNDRFRQQVIRQGQEKGDLAGVGDIPAGRAEMGAGQGPTPVSAWVPMRQGMPAVSAMVTIFMDRV